MLQYDLEQVLTTGCQLISTLDVALKTQIRLYEGRSKNTIYLETVVVNTRYRIVV